MQTLNRLTLLGNVGKIFAITKGVKVSVAAERSWNDEGGKRQKRTDWVTVTVLNERRAKWIVDNLGVGDSVYVEARVAETSFKKGDETIYTTDIIASVFTRVHPRGEQQDEDSGEE